MAKKTKIKKTLVEQILSKAKIEHKGLQLNALAEHPADGLDRSQIYKTLALTGDKTGTLIGILPITEHLSEKKMAKISGNKKVSMIPQKDLEKTTGYIHGANNPVGIRQKHNFPIYIDQSALERDSISFLPAKSAAVSKSRLKIWPILFKLTLQTSKKILAHNSSILHLISQ